MLSFFCFWYKIQAHFVLIELRTTFLLCESEDCRLGFCFVAVYFWIYLGSFLLLVVCVLDAKLQIRKKKFLPSFPQANDAYFVFFWRKQLFDRRKNSKSGYQCQTREDLLLFFSGWTREISKAQKKVFSFLHLPPPSCLRVVFFLTINFCIIFEKLSLCTIACTSHRIEKTKVTCRPKPCLLCSKLVFRCFDSFVFNWASGGN